MKILQGFAEGYIESIKLRRGMNICLLLIKFPTPPLVDTLRPLPYRKCDGGRRDPTVKPCELEI